MTGKTIRIGGASGFWGESDMALPQFLAAGGLDYIVFDYLAEVTLSIMARARASDPEKGYATDFVSAVMKPNLAEIARQGVKIVSNAGGMNPLACAAAIEALINEAGLDLKVAVITGDDLIDRAGEFAGAGHGDMFSGEAFPDVEKVASINAYLGAAPVAEALRKGADIVITGRGVDSAVTLGACIHAFDWAMDDWDKLAAASLAGHIIECGPQATGGNFTDWEDVADTLDVIGYPIAEIASDGGCTITKPEGTGGQVTTATVGEQMLYEIGDPKSYILPDVVCDFSGVTLTQIAPDKVAIAGAVGHSAPDTLKVSVTYADGWRAGTSFFFIGQDAPKKAQTFAEMSLKRARRKLQRMNAPDFTETLIEMVGDGSTFGDDQRDSTARDVTVKLAVKHEDPRAAGLILKEATGLALATPPGLTLFGGNRAKPSPVVRLFSLLLPREQVMPVLHYQGSETEVPMTAGQSVESADQSAPSVPEGDADREVPLYTLAWARSGDKGDKANIGVLPRDPAFAPWIWAALDEDTIRQSFAHFLNGDVERFYLPSTGAMNILLHEVLGGGGMASLRNDPQGKAYAQILLETPIAIPSNLARSLI
ncbi:MAG: acyclic terpene utilization AtuA family protein [Pseudomonadota bacterium]